MRQQVLVALWCEPSPLSRAPCGFASLLQKPEVHLPAAKRRKLQDKEDLDELQRDYSLMRRLKKGKISVAEFELETDPQEGL